MSNLPESDLSREVAEPASDVMSLFATREVERYALHTRYMNENFVRVLKTIGYDVGFCRGQGPYLFDRSGARYLDLLRISLRISGGTRGLPPRRLDFQCQNDRSPAR